MSVATMSGWTKRDNLRHRPEKKLRKKEFRIKNVILLSTASVVIRLFPVGGHPLPQCEGPSGGLQERLQQQALPYQRPP